MPPVLLAHADGESSFADAIAGPLHDAGYDVVYEGTILVGESLIQEASAALQAGSPVVLCGTVEAMGTGWAHQVVNAARRYSSSRIFALQMERRAYLDPLSIGDHIAAYWEDPGKAVSDLIAALRKYYPTDSALGKAVSDGLEVRYRELALRSYDIVDLANLPVTDPNLATRQLLLRSLYVALRVSSEPGLDGADETTQSSGRSAATTGLTERVVEQAKRLSVGKLLGECRRLVVLGDPGAGKSTLLRWLATACLLKLNADPDLQELPDVAELPDEDWLPILVRCRDHESRTAQSLTDLLKAHLAQLGVAGAELDPLTELLLDRLTDGRALLLLDGLDEIVRPAARARFCKRIEQMHVSYPQAPIIATSRIVGYRETGLRIGRGFVHATVLELTREDKDEFASRWCTLTEPAGRAEIAAQELIKDIHSTDRIERLTGNPMLLTTMALVKKKVGKLPSKRADLYREAVDVLLNWRSDVDELLDPHEARPQLEYLAYAMCQRGVQQLREDEILQLLTAMRQEFRSVHAAHRHEPLEFLRLLERRTGILVEIGRVKHSGRLVPTFEFRHLTFQEYLAGLALVEGRYPGRDRQLSLADAISPLAAQTSTSGDEPMVSENWREAIRLCVTSCNDDDVDAVLLAIAGPRENEDGSVTARPRAILALSCLADEPNVSEVTATTLMDRFAGIVHVDDDFGGACHDAVTEVSASLWGAQLSRSLVMAWIAADDSSTVLGALASLGGRVRAPRDPQALRAWLAERNEELSGTDPTSRICAALCVMDAVFAYRSASWQDLLPRAFTRRLLSMLDCPGREADAAAWATMWLTDEDRGGAIWQPSSKQVSALLDLSIAPRTTALTTYFLIMGLDADYSRHEDLPMAVASRIARLAPGLQEAIVGRYQKLFPSHVSLLVPLLIAQLGDSSSYIRTWAATRLARVGPAARGPLDDWRKAQHTTVGPEAVAVLAYLGDEQALGEMDSSMRSGSIGTRRRALWAMAVTEEDRCDRILLSGDADGEEPGIDPAERIMLDQVDRYAEATKLTAAEVRERYLRLRDRYHLTLEWDS